MQLKMPRLVPAGLFCLAIAACGSGAAPDAVEQIVVSEPGAEKSFASAEADGDTGDKNVIASGAAAFAICAGCHVIEPGASSTIGPNLHDVLGRKAGVIEGYGYSDALAASDIVWTEAELDAYIADPQAKIVGTTMVAGAVGDEKTRRAIIAYLASQSN